MENNNSTLEQNSQKDEKWMPKWQESGLHNTPEWKEKSKKFYCLDMFPYPSGSGLHVGHVEGYTASDIISRYRRMKGDAVLHPMGWDAFGLPAENFAIKTGVHPNITTDEAIKTFKEQMNSLGLSYDWSREIQTSKPEYYKWTQWFFLLLYNNGLAYKKKGRVNWCESCQTVLANEQAENGVCERCGSNVVQKDLEQWYFKITDFVEDGESVNGANVKGLISGLDSVDWPDSTKAAQKNWIGKSTGVEFDLAIESSEEKIKVYTTRIDTVYGLTYVVLAPEHELIKKLAFENKTEVEEYLQKVKTKTELERMEAKEKTGVELKGISAINPFTNESIPVYIADYVLVNYGTGAVMAVPAHDERDFAFAKKYGLPIKQSIAINKSDFDSTIKTLEVLSKIKTEASKEGIDFWLLGGLACAFYAGVIYRKHDDLDLIVKDNEQFPRFISLIERLGFKKTGEKKVTEMLTNSTYKNEDDVEIDIGPYDPINGIALEDFECEINLNDYTCQVLKKDFIKAFKKTQLESRKKDKDKLDMEYLEGKILTEDGIVVDSGDFSGLASEEAREKMAAWLEDKGIGAKKVNYRLRDWLVSRQRYWGAPIPIIYCPVCGEVPVPEKDLPVELPLDVDFKPTGESPLVNSKSFHERVCPKCGGPARMENDTMDTFVCSSWYYFRFLNPHLTDKFADSEEIKKWMPVDVYIGGAEHTVLHLLYARFFTKVLQRLGYVEFNEPFLKLRHPGTILAEDGTKMSKSKGNVVNPDDMVRAYGPDALRLHEMFLGAFDDFKPWNTKAISGVKRFLEKIKNLSDKIKDDADLDLSFYSKTNKELNRSIKKIGEDIQEFKFNTAISQLMILVNEMGSHQAIPKSYYEKLLLVLAPLAPFTAEDMWEKIGNSFSIHQNAWPQYDETQLVFDEVNLPVQINGKTRGTISIAVGEDQDVVVAKIVSDEKLKKYLDGGHKKVIFVKDKIINFIV